MKRFYECTFIVNPGLDDGQIENTVKMAEDTIVKNGGEIVNIEQIGRRRLAYPITKKHNGFYISIEFEAEGRIIDKVERFLTLDENVMRFLTVNLDARELAAKRNRTALALQERGKDDKNADNAKANDKKDKAESKEKAEDSKDKAEDSKEKADESKDKADDSKEKADDSKAEAEKKEGEDASSDA